MNTVAVSALNVVNTEGVVPTPPKQCKLLGAKVAGVGTITTVSEQNIWRWALIEDASGKEHHVFICDLKKDMLELARSAYTLLVHKYPNGLTRDQLAAKLGTSDRSARDAVNACRYLAATKPLGDGRVFIVGFDPETLRYVAARDEAQARRIIAYQASRVEDINRGLAAQRDAYQQMFGVPYRASEQEALF